MTPTPDAATSRATRDPSPASAPSREPLAARAPGRLCHINLAPGFRGGERQTQLLVAELAARGWPQRLVARRGGALAGRCAGIPGLEIEGVPPNPLSAALAARGSALVHAHEERAVYSGWLLKRRHGVPFVMTRRLRHAGNRSWARAWAWRSADCLVVLSEYIARSVRAHHPELECRIVPSAQAGLLNGAAAARRVLSGLEGRTIVGHLGELDHSHKGQGTIIEAARALEAARPELAFVLAGEGRDAARFRAQAAGLRNVRFAGFVEDVGDYLAAFDLFVYPSLHEGLGSALLDAMAFGLPIIASRVGGIPEIVEDGVNGLLVPPGQPDELARALVRLLDDPALCASMSRANRARAADFTAARMADAYEAIYRSLLDPRATP